MKPTNPRRLSPAELEALTRRDRNRLILLSVAAVLLVASYLGARLVGDRARDKEAESEPRIVAEAAQQNGLVIPAFDRQDLLAEIEDATAEQRLTLSHEALNALLIYSNFLTARHYAELDAPAVDAARVAELAADPDAWRAKPFAVRGSLEDLGRRSRSEKLDESYATLRLEDGARVHIAFVMPPPGELGVGDFVHMDGLFVQNYRGAVNGALVEGPLFAGRAIERSYPPIAALDHETLRQELIATVRDDELGDVSGEPFDELWKLMAFAAERADEVDWAAAPEMNTTTLNGIASSGDAFRAFPFRLPISQNMGTYTEAAGENPLRLERVTRGWIGNFAWTGAVPVIQWVAPFDAPELADRYGKAKLVTGRGFFLKNVYYEQNNRDPGRAPLFVMTSIEPFDPPVDARPAQIALAMLGLVIGTIVLIWFLLRRDKKAAAELQATLARRRRARSTRIGSEKNKTPKA